MLTHIRAKPADIAPYVLLPGDPDRAEYMATTYLSGVRQYNRHRHLYGFTGTIDDVPVSVQATGMGAPSAAIVIEELITLGARTLIRVGTCGTAHPGVEIGDCIVASAACSLSQVTATLTGFNGYAPCADFLLTRMLHDVARGRGLRVAAGLIASSDLFYDPRDTLIARLTRFGVLALEMEAATLFTIAAREGRSAGCILTVTDAILGKQQASEAQLRGAVDSLTQSALSVCVALERSVPTTTSVVRAKRSKRL
jgi:DeoD family purine-nucleoside phosphorylase